MRSEKYIRKIEDTLRILMKKIEGGNMLKKIEKYEHSIILIYDLHYC